jgi:hypothetical protein
LAHKPIDNFKLLPLFNLKEFYPLPVLPILPVNSFYFSILPVNLKHGKSSTLDRMG